MKKGILSVFFVVFAITCLQCGELITGNGKKLEGFLVKNGIVFTLKTAEGKLYQFDQGQLRSFDKIDRDVTATSEEAKVENKDTAGNDTAKAAAEPVAVKKEALPEIMIRTTEGDITLVLFEDEAPNTVANFINLIDSKFYDNILFHRIVPGFVAQAGDPNTKGERGKDFILHEDLLLLQKEGKPVPDIPVGGTGDPGYKIKAEFNSNRHARGSLAMARSTHVDSAGSQFYICYNPQPKLDGKYTVFGKVLTGMEVVDKLTQSSRIKEIEVLKRRSHEYVTEKIK